MKKVRIKDVALQAGVSTGTVDRVIHNRGRVHPDVKKKVEKVMKELGYVRNVFASALAKNQMVRLGVLIPDPELDPYWKQLFTGIEKATKFVQHHGIQVEHYFFDLHDAKSFLRQAKKMMKTSYEGVLFPPIYKKEGMWLLKTCKQKNIPNIIINTFIEHTESLCYIGQDSYQSGVLAARLIKSSTADPATFLILNLTKGAHQKQHLFEKARGFKDYFKNDKSVNVLLGEFEDFSNQRKLKNYFKRIQKKHPDLTGIFLTNSRAYFAVEALGADFLEKIKIKKTMFMF
ncbi:MAG: substrate-binding domain-containing protein [Bacteroidota bacterium]